MGSRRNFRRRDRTFLDAISPAEVSLECGRLAAAFVDAEDLLRSSQARLASPPLDHNFDASDTPGAVYNHDAGATFAGRGAACESRCSAIHPEIPQCGMEGLRPSLPRCWPHDVFANAPRSRKLMPDNHQNRIRISGSSRNHHHLRRRHNIKQIGRAHV